MHRGVTRKQIVYAAVGYSVTENTRSKKTILVKSKSRGFLLELLLTGSVGTAGRGVVTDTNQSGSVSKRLRFRRPKTPDI